jgi:two-component sensor histidine kinase
MAKALIQRLTASGPAHDLVRPPPSGQGSAALLGDLFAILLAPYDDEGAFAGRIRIALPCSGVGEGAATNFALVIRELTTNSLKYGVLSSEIGMLEVSGQTIAIMSNSSGRSRELRTSLLWMAWADTGADCWAARLMGRLWDRSPSIGQKSGLVIRIRIDRRSLSK